MRRYASRLAATVPVFSGLAFIFILIAGQGVLGGDQSPVPRETKEMATPQDIKASAKVAIPPIDAGAPARTETATFALG